MGREQHLNECGRGILKIMLAESLSRVGQDVVRKELLREGIEK